MKPILLIVEDDDGIRVSLEKSFLRRDYKVFGTSGVSGANRIMSEQKIDIILLDLRLIDGSGFDVLKTARDLDKEIVVIIMTAFPEVKTAVRAMKAGASDFVIKPFELEELHLTVERAMETRTLRRNVRLLERERRRISDISEILGKSQAIDYIRELIFKVAVTDSPVLVTGETGTGKELVADAIHRLSPRSGGPLVKVNCSALSEELLQSELFGHEKGSFTDAKQARSGLFEMADNGTLFLDEISEMKDSLQAKLLRVVEGHPFRRVGGQREIQTNVRLIAATNRDLSMSLRSGIIREDLYFRLNRFQINVPPLRSRGGDIVLLARFFIEESAKALRKGSILLTPEVEDILLAYRWPGNVRELRNMMERAVILCEGSEVTVSQLPGEIQSSGFVREQIDKGFGTIPPLAEMECQYILHVVRNSEGNLSKAARILGISRNTLKAKLPKPEDVPSDASGT